MPSFGDDPRSATRQAPVTAATFSKGEVLAGKYRIEKVLGRGGMGHVFAAKHVTLGHLVAIKVMHRDLLRDADAVMRFDREAQAAASLKGNHSVRLFDHGTLESGQPYMVMEHLEGHVVQPAARAAAPAPTPKKQASRLFWWAAPIVLLVASAASATVAFYLYR